MKIDFFALTFQSPFSLSSCSTELKACLALVSKTEEEDKEGIEVLSEIEKETFEKYQHPERKKSYLLGRYCAKQAISKLVSLPSFASISILSGAFRHPLIRGISQNGLAISLAHSKNSAVAIAHFDTYPCGVDIEIINLFPKEPVINSLKENERAILVSHFPTEEECFALAWCAKESLAKAIKTGLTLPLSFLEIHSIEKIQSQYQVYYRHFPQYSSLNFVFEGRMISITKPKTVDIYGLDLPLYSR